MNRAAVFITAFIIILISGGVWLYDHYFNRPEATIWDLVPENSSLIYEPEKGVSILDDLEGSDVWKSLSELAEYQVLSTRLDLLDSTTEKSGIDPFIRSGNLLITLNPVSGTDFDLLYLVDRKAGASQLDALVARIVEGGNYKFSQRQFNTFTIYEVSGEGKTFSYSFDDDYWWGSFSPFLTEDVIRQLTEEDKHSFMQANPEPFFSARIGRDAGNVYFNYRHLARLLATFLQPSSRDITRDLSEAGKSAFLDLSVSDKMILLTGFSYYSEDSGLKGLEGRTPAKSNMSLYIPSATAFFWNGFSEDIPGIGEELKSTLNGEIAVATLEGLSLGDAGKLLFIRSDQVSKSDQIIRQLALKAVEAEGDTLYEEPFSEHTILELRDKELAGSLGKYMDPSQETLLYTQVDNLLVFGRNMQTLKELLVDIETENTWGKSVRKNTFLDNTLEESSLGIYMDINRSWNFVMEQMHPSWREYFEKNSAVYRNFDLLAVQFSYTDRKFFTNMVVSFNSENSTLLTRRKRLDADISLDIGADAVLKPRLVRNHTSPEREVIIQGADGMLHLISPSRGILWSDSLDSKIVDDIIQVDFYRNNKLQYAFATDSAIHVVDRLGKEVEGFPRKTNFRIDHFNVIDYDNTRRYRFIMSDIRGNIYLLDQQGKMLEGWMPRQLEGRLARAPFHVRVRGRDCIIALQENGSLNILNRRGEMYPGFPLKLGPDVQPDFNITIGGTFDNTVITLISRDGLVQRFDLNGKQLGSQQIFRPTRTTEFFIVPEIQGKDFVIVSKDIAYFQVMDKNTKEIFRSNLISTRPFQYQYYDFGSNRKLYVVTDPEQEFSYLFDRSGNLINNSPIDSKFDISVLFSERNSEYKIYSAYENKVNIYSF